MKAKEIPDCFKPDTPANFHWDEIALVSLTNKDADVTTVVTGLDCEQFLGANIMPSGSSLDSSGPGNVDARWLGAALKLPLRILA